MKRTGLRALAGLFAWVLLAGLGLLAPPPSHAATECGRAGQRACCVAERVPSCYPGFHEVGGCSGDCRCGGFNPGGIANAIGHCEADAPPPTIADCGGPGQRACCVTERVTPCNHPGTFEIGGCSGNCVCGGPNPGGLLKSISRCVGVTPCGGANQRACCVTERVPSCNPGFMEVGGCTGDCRCGGSNPAGALNSIGHCAPLPAIPQSPVSTQQPGTVQQPATSCQNALAALAAAHAAVQQQCAPAGGAKQAAPATKQNVGAPVGFPAKSIAPGTLQRPVTK